MLGVVSAIYLYMDRVYDGNEKIDKFSSYRSNNSRSNRSFDTDRDETTCWKDENGTALEGRSVAREGRHQRHTIMVRKNVPLRSN